MKNTKIAPYENGSINAKGKFKNGEREGYWKWYRKDGTKLKTGYYKDGILVKKLMRYDKKGNLIKNK